MSYNTLINVTATPQRVSSTQFSGIITLVAALDNAETVYIGNNATQLIELRSGDSMDVSGAKLPEFYTKGTPGDILHLIQLGDMGTS